MNAGKRGLMKLTRLDRERIRLAARKEGLTMIDYVAKHFGKPKKEVCKCKK